MNKLYVVVRGDLPLGAQIAQSCHAVSAYAVAFPDEHREWHTKGQNLVVLATSSEPQLRVLLHLLEHEHGIRCSAFFEPDFGDSLTAFAVPDSAQRFLSQLPLAARPARAA